MRVSPPSRRQLLLLIGVAALLVGPSLIACAALDSLGTGGGGAGSGGEGGVAADGSAVDATVAGQGCGVERGTGLTLCRSTSVCPNLVVDSEAFPDCGFLIRGAAVDLVCACGESLCSMGAYVTCSQAGQLLTSQTETGVCSQVADGRCTDIAASTSSSSSSSTSSTSSSSTSSSSSSSSGSGSSSCDRQCLSECGGGAACAQMCGCP